MLTELVETSNTFFKNLKSRGCISEKDLKYFLMSLRKPLI